MAYKIKIIILGVLVIIVVALVATLLKSKPIKEKSTQSPVTTPASTSLPTTPPVTQIPDVSVIVSSLNIPWDIAFLPNGEFLVTERNGNLVQIKKEADNTYSKTSMKLPHPVPKGEGGLLGIVLHPRFNENKMFYLYMTTKESSSGTKNTVFRYVLNNGKLENEKIIIENIPGALYHDGGRMEFGPDGLLYITTGDAQTSAIAQDLKSLGGKILRLNDDGTIPKDNPFGTTVYSYGHRNPQGLTWDDSGRLWETEHGRSGVTSGMDELNIINKGKNYGWPAIEGDKTRAEMVTPVLNSGPDVTWAPASALYYKGSVFFGGLISETLYEAVLDGDRVKELKAHFSHQYGRIRSVRLGPDGMFYLTTSNRDGRGKAISSDDRIVRVNPKAL